MDFFPLKVLAGGLTKNKEEMISLDFTADGNFDDALI